MGPTPCGPVFRHFTIIICEGGGRPHVTSLAAITNSSEAGFFPSLSAANGASRTAPGGERCSSNGFMLHGSPSNRTRDLLITSQLDLLQPVREVREVFEQTDDRGVLENISVELHDVRDTACQKVRPRSV